MEKFFPSLQLTGKQDQKTLDYATVVVDFLNAKNLNEAFFQLLDNIASAFVFQPGWAASIKQYGFYCDIESKPKNPKDQEMQWISSWLYSQNNVTDVKANKHINMVINAFINKHPICNDYNPKHFPNGKYLHPFITYIFKLTDIYDKKCKPRTLVKWCPGNDYLFEIVSIPPFADFDFVNTKYSDNSTRVISIATLSYAFIYCFIEFIRCDLFNVLKLKLCPYCDRFFHAKDIRRIRCYDPECKRLYDAERQWKLRDKNPAKHGTTSGEKRNYQKKMSHEN